MENEEIIEGLNSALEAEFYAMSFLYQCAYNITGTVSYQLYHEYFKQGFKSELKHIKLLSKQLQGYKVPVKYPNVNPPIFDTIEDMLEHLLEIEISAVDMYTQLAETCTRLNNTAMNNFFADLAQEEENDRKSVIKRINK